MPRIRSRESDVCLESAVIEFKEFICSVYGAKAKVKACVVRHSTSGTVHFSARTVVQHSRVNLSVSGQLSLLELRRTSPSVSFRTMVRETFSSLKKHTKVELDKPRAFCPLLMNWIDVENFNRFVDEIVWLV